MDTKTSNFQIIILGIFGFFVIVGLILFATTSTSNNGNQLTPIVIWGTFPSASFDKLKNSILDKQKDSLSLSYFEKSPDTFEQDLVEAIANGNGPDVILLSQDFILKDKNKILAVPYTSFPLRTFQDSFIDEGSVYLTSDGVLAFPFVVDPMVLYWNKTHFVNASVVNPPQFWDDFASTTAILTKKDSNFNVTQSGSAMGEFDNIVHAKDILSMLMMQAGSSLVSKDRDGNYISTLASGTGNIDNPADSALTFFTNFANPIKNNYSWNKSLDDSLTKFLGGSLSMYLGYASELSSINLKNPNLNFDVSLVPQIRDTKQELVFARMSGFAILKSSKNSMSAFTQISTLTSKDAITSLISITNLPPVRRDVLSDVPKDLYMKVFYDSALRAKAWSDPSPTETNQIFRDMIENTIVGRIKSSDAVNQADKQMDVLLKDVK